MAIKDLVYETTSTTGTADFAPAGAKSAEYRTIAAAHSSGQKLHYVCRGGLQWEVGEGTWNGSVLERTTVHDGSSGAGVKVNFAAGVKELYETMHSGSVLDLAGIAASSTFADGDKVLVLKADGSLQTILGSIIKASGTGGSTSPAATVPGAPTAVAATAGNGSAVVSGTAPSNNGGAAITVYRATSSPGGITATSATLPVAVTGLTNGTAYTFTLAAQNSVGYGAESSASNSITPTAPAQGANYDTLSVLNRVNASGSSPATYTGDGVTHDYMQGGAIWGKKFAANTDGYAILESDGNGVSIFGVAEASIADVPHRNKATFALANFYGNGANYEVHKGAEAVLAYAGTHTAPNSLKPEPGDRVKIERTNSAGGGSTATLTISVARAATPNTFVTLLSAPNFPTSELGVHWYITGTPSVTKLQSSGLVAR